MVMAETAALALMAKAYDVMEESWLALGETGRLFTAGSKPASEVVRLMEDLQSNNNVHGHVHKGTNTLVLVLPTCYLFIDFLLQFFNRSTCSR